MTVHDFDNEYFHLSKERKLEFFTSLIDYHLKKEQRGEDSDFLGEVLRMAILDEEDDYYGTEGFNG